MAAMAVGGSGGGGSGLELVSGKSHFRLVSRDTLDRKWRVSHVISRCSRDEITIQSISDCKSYGPAQENEAHSGRNPRWLMGSRDQSANRLL
ncbi:hypothetical protein ElyMa_005850200 [Elysia marginata]|uniref:Uncharacterized protein n=1 Tax=Elysia marginata TaxID=1093978 RepID=A0AAV4G0M0_9GAST|nr:hypothetical protein ElyMa_005850200 [Elysia marginata]